MPATPDTFNYMVMGYAVFWLLGFGFMFSMWLRARNLEQDVKVLRQVVERDSEE